MIVNPNKEKAEFTTFFDGVVTIGGEQYNFGEKGVSFKRHYTAKTASVNIAKVIAVPYTTSIYPNDLCTIDGYKYVIENVQPVWGGTPPHTVLTLTEFEVNR